MSGKQADAAARVIGLMSGTSMDGVDVALIETDGEEAIALGPSRSYAYTGEDRALLRGAVRDAQADAMVTDRHAAAVESFLATESIDRTTIELIGFHGQTVLHRPERRLTVQIGDGKSLATKLGMRVAFDFRAADMAQGGQGAPLVPVFHRALAAAAGFLEPVAVINIGGVNLSFIAPGKEPIACDTGPGNALLDDLMLQRPASPSTGQRHGCPRRVDRRLC
jgi:anhydro-N-acetylmuramic acid kinase